MEEPKRKRTGLSGGMGQASRAVADSGLTTAEFATELGINRNR